MELIAREAGDGDQQRQGHRQPEPRQRDAEDDDGADDGDQRLPRESADGITAFALDGQRLEQHQRAEQSQHDAQPDREIAGPGAGRRSEAVVRGAPGKHDAGDEKHQAGPEVSLTLDLHEQSPPMLEVNAF